MNYFKFNLKVYISILLTLVVLCLSKTMFFNWKSKISIYTNAEDNIKISVEYRKTKNSSLRHINIDKAVNGKYVLKLKGRMISYIKIDTPPHYKNKKS